MLSIIVRLLGRQSSSDCLLFPSEQKVGEKVWMRKRGSLNEKRQIYEAQIICPTTHTMLHPPTKLALCAYQPTFNIFRHFRWWAPMTIPYTCHKEEKLNLELEKPSLCEKTHIMLTRRLVWVLWSLFFLLSTKVREWYDFCDTSTHIYAYTRIYVVIFSWTSGCMLWFSRHKCGYVVIFVLFHD